MNRHSLVKHRKTLAGLPVALISVEIYLDDLQNPCRPWFWSFGQVAECHEDGMKQTCSHSHFGKTYGKKQTGKQANKQTNKQRPGSFAAEKVPAPAGFSFNVFSETWSL